MLFSPRIYMFKMDTFYTRISMKLICWWLILKCITGNDGLESMSIVIDKDYAVSPDFIQILNPPSVLRQRVLILEYRCTRDLIAGIEILSDVEELKSKIVFEKAWRCSESVEFKQRRVKIKLPNYLAYNENHFNTDSKSASRTKVRAWILDRDARRLCKMHGACYTRSIIKVAYETQILTPFERPFVWVTADCRKWSWDILSLVSSSRIPTCPVEPEIVQLIEYPAVMNGMPYGVYRKLTPFTNTVLEEERLQTLTKPRFTVSMWLYVLEYCPENLCGIMWHFAWDGTYRTPLIFLTTEGKLHIQITHTDGHTSAAVTHIAVPKHSWFRLIFTFSVRQWHILLNYGKEFQETLETEYTHSGMPVYMDDTEGLIAFGGAESLPSFRGYIGQATMYRNRNVEPEKIPFPSPFHPMFELRLSRREEACQHYIHWLTRRIRHYAELRKRKWMKYSCPKIRYKTVMYVDHPPVLPKCPLSGRRHHLQWSLANTIVRKAVMSHRRLDLIDIANQLYANATAMIERGLENVPSSFTTLKQASCFGSNDAMYAVSVILNNGVHVKMDEIQSHAYLMLGALDKHRLSALALGHKHIHGIDGVPVDLEQAYLYHKYVADTTMADKEKHSETDVATEHVRLTDEAALREQTEEEGSIFTWMKHQAKQGVISAQTHVAQRFFWGSGGVKRNLEAAAKYFKMSAESEDPQSVYDYGIVQMKGQGTKTNVDEGLKRIQRSAEMKHPNAMNALGWYAMTHENNYTAAAAHFEEAYAHGDPDAAYNLGILHLHGTYPGRDKDPDRALAYFNFAGPLGHIDAGVAIAYQNMKGTANLPRDVNVAVEWARHIAEKNPAIGYLLRKAVTAYRRGDMDASLYYYLLAGDTGVEVASFNVAYLCEENNNGVASFIGKDCIWRAYNITTLRQPHLVDPYALIKMGDYYWYGCAGLKDVQRAARYYIEGAAKHDPHALFNIGFMVEEGAFIPRHLFHKLAIPSEALSSNVTLLEHLYQRCKDSVKREAMIPCSIALWRVQFTDFWQRYRTVIEMTGFGGIAVLTAISGYVVAHTHWRHRQMNTDTI